MDIKSLVKTPIIKFNRNEMKQTPAKLHLDTEEIATRSGHQRCFIININAKKSVSSSSSSSLSSTHEYSNIQFLIQPSPSTNHKKYTYKLCGKVGGEIKIFKNIQNIDNDDYEEEIHYIMTRKHLIIDSQKSSVSFTVIGMEYEPFNDGIAIDLNMYDARWTKSRKKKQLT